MYPASYPITLTLTPPVTIALCTVRPHNFPPFQGRRITELTLTSSLGANQNLPYEHQLLGNGKRHKQHRLLNRSMNIDARRTTTVAAGNETAHETAAAEAAPTSKRNKDTSAASRKVSTISKRDDVDGDDTLEAADGARGAWDVYCDGPLLAAVQDAGLFPDSKTFVDMPMNKVKNDVTGVHICTSSRLREYSRMAKNIRRAYG